MLLFKKKWFPIAFALKRVWASLLQYFLFCPMRVKYAGTLPKAPYIIVSNHSSYLDTFFMYRVFHEYFLFIGKGELLKWPLFRLFFRTMDIPIDRSNSKRAYNSLQKAYEALDRGECVALYPEGTIPLSSPKMKAFKNGAFRMAIDKQVPIVAVTWQTNFLIMNNPEKLFSRSLPHFVRAVVHEPIFPKGSDEADLIALRNEVFQVIDSALPHSFQRKHTNHVEYLDTKNVIT